MNYDPHPEIHSGFYVLGTFDATGLGHACEARIHWRLHAGALLMWGSVTDLVQDTEIWGGHCIDVLTTLFPRDKHGRRMAEIARRWSFNDTRRGTPQQEAHLRSARYPGYPVDFFSWARSELWIAGLQPDNGHVYGTRLLREDLPFDVHAEIMAWTNSPTN